MIIRTAFNTPYKQFECHNGKTFDILKKNKPMELEESESYLIKLSSGEMINALPEEIFTNVYIATIQIAIEAKTDGEASDIISTTFSENLFPTILDWQYEFNNNRHIWAKNIGLVDLNTINEGDIFKIDASARTV